MAKPIKETPMLLGKDAIKFDHEMVKAKKEIIPADTRARMKSNYSALKSIAEF